jgi:hypothetical protein
VCVQEAGEAGGEARRETVVELTERLLQLHLNPVVTERSAQVCVRTAVRGVWVG